MNDRQRESIAKYFYDISKGIAILCIVGNIVKVQWAIGSLIFGFIATTAFFVGAYRLERGFNNE